MSAASRCERRHDAGDEWCAERLPQATANAGRGAEHFSGSERAKRSERAAWVDPCDGADADGSLDGW